MNSQQHIQQHIKQHGAMPVYASSVSTMLLKKTWSKDSTATTKAALSFCASFTSPLYAAS